MVTLTTVATVYFIVKHYNISIQLMKANELARPSGRLTLPDDQVYRDAEKHRSVHIDDH